MGKDEEGNVAESGQGNEAAFPTRSLPDVPQELGQEIGRYKLLSILGEGGFGIVYLAEQKEPVRRRVALKIIKPGMDSKQVIARFEAERQALALLDHPNIAKVHDAGTTEHKRPYFVMEYVKGVPITGHCDEHKLNTEQRLRLFIDVCDAVQYAHQKGIIHRDIKPSNVLVSLHGERAVPKVIDFGVAKATSQPLTVHTLFTQQGQLVGTPEYMSPEQAQLTNQDIDTRSDIYSLGVLLYELLTGTLPFDPETFREAAFDEMLRIIRDEEPPRPSTKLLGLGEKASSIAIRRRTDIKTLSKRLHNELEWIPLMAMRKERDRRYKTASELSADIQNYLEGDPLIAGPESVAYRVRKFTHKHFQSVASLALIILVLLAGLGISTRMYMKADQLGHNLSYQLERTRVAESQARRESARANDNANSLKRSLYASLIALADKEWFSGDIYQCRRTLASCAEEMRGWEWHHIKHVVDSRVVSIPASENESLDVISVSSDAKYIVSGGDDSAVNLWDVAEASLIMRHKAHKERVTALAFNLSCTQFASGSEDGSVKIWDIETKSCIRTLTKNRGAVHSVNFSPDGHLLVSASPKDIRIWDMTASKELMWMPRGSPGAVLFNSQGDRIIMTSSQMDEPDSEGKPLYETVILDARTGSQLETCATSHRNSRPLISADGEYMLLSFGISPEISHAIWDLKRYERTREASGYVGNWMNTSHALGPGGRLLAVGDRGGRVRIIDTTTGIESRALKLFNGWVSCCAFAADGEKLISGSEAHDMTEGALHICDLPRIQTSDIMFDEDRDIYRIAASPDRKHIALAVGPSSVKVYDILSSNKAFLLPDVPSDQFGFGADSEIVTATVKQNPRIQVYDILEQKSIRILSEGRKYAPMVVSPDGLYIVAYSYEDSHLIELNANTGEVIDDIDTNELSFPVYSLDISHDSKYLAMGSCYGEVIIYDTEEDDLLHRLKAMDYDNLVMDLDFSQDSGQIVAANRSGVMAIWNVSDGMKIAQYQHGSELWTVCFSPDGTRIASGGLDGNVKVWRADGGGRIITLNAGSTVRSVAFIDSGSRLLAGCGDGKVRVWKSGH